MGPPLPPPPWLRARPSILWRRAGSNIMIPAPVPSTSEPNRRSRCAASKCSTPMWRINPLVAGRRSREGDSGAARWGSDELSPQRNQPKRTRPGCERNGDGSRPSVRQPRNLSSTAGCDGGSQHPPRRSGQPSNRTVDAPTRIRSLPGVRLTGVPAQPSIAHPEQPRSAVSRPHPRLARHRPALSPPAAFPSN